MEREQERKCRMGRQEGRENGQAGRGEKGAGAALREQGSGWTLVGQGEEGGWHVCQTARPPPTSLFAPHSSSTPSDLESELESMGTLRPMEMSLAGMDYCL